MNDILSIKCAKLCASLKSTVYDKCLEFVTIDSAAYRWNPTLKQGKLSINMCSTIFAHCRGKYLEFVTIDSAVYRWNLTLNEGQIVHKRAKLCTSLKPIVYALQRQVLGICDHR